MGLLDNIFNTEGGRLGLGLLAAGSARSDGAGFGQRLGEAVGSLDNWKKQQAQQMRAEEEAKQMQAYRAMQMQEMQSRAEQQKMAQADALAMRGAATSAYITPEQANARSMGPMPDGSNVPQVQSGFDDQAYVQNLYGLGRVQDAMQHQAAIAKDDAPVKLGAGDQLYSGKASGYRPLLSVPAKPEASPELTKLMEKRDSLPPNHPDRRTYDQMIQKVSTHQPSTIVNTGDNLGLKPKDRFDMEDKLRNDYVTATKADTEIIANSQDLKNILTQGGALKDQAAIYKFAKSLDPMGAVREADYAAIVKTAGGLDYVTALFNKALTGEQLSPNQRVEMGNLMGAMAGVAQKRLAAQQKRFTNNAKMYNLKPENIFQQEADDGWGIVK